MKKVLALLSMTRIGNSFMAGAGIALGYGYAIEDKKNTSLLLLILAGMSALGFGNVINDIVDIETDRISHPDRPLPQGVVSKKESILFMFFLALLSIILGTLVSPLHGIATTTPLLLLTLYSLLLKGTPLAGNSVVSVMVAYTLIYGALGGDYTPLLIPALLATLSCMNREIIKDLDDFEGDNQMGLKTTATLPPYLIKTIITLLAILYLLLAPLPFLMKQMGLPYITVIITIILPLHILWIIPWKKGDFEKSAKMLKLQMVAGLLAILADWIIVWNG